MHRVQVKICGIVDEAGLNAAVEHCADAVGFVFTQSPRQIQPAAALELVKLLPPRIASVGVFRRPTEAEATQACKDSGVRCAQMDQEVAAEMPAELRAIPVFRVERTIENLLSLFKRSDYRTRVIEGLRSGVGETVDWNLVAPLARVRPIALAGGLTPDNVAEAIRTVRPAAVDVSSGVESSPGKKDPIKIRDFLQAVRDVNRELQ